MSDLDIDSQELEQLEANAKMSIYQIYQSVDQTLSLQQLLRSGVILGELCNSIEPSCINLISEETNEVYIQNLSQVRNQLLKIGLTEEQLFDVNEVQSPTPSNFTIYSLSKVSIGLCTMVINQNSPKCSLCGFQSELFRCVDCDQLFCNHITANPYESHLFWHALAFNHFQFKQIDANQVSSREIISNTGEKYLLLVQVAQSEHSKSFLCKSKNNFMLIHIQSYETFKSESHLSKISSLKQSCKKIINLSHFFAYSNSQPIICFIQPLPVLKPKLEKLSVKNQLIIILDIITSFINLQNSNCPFDLNDNQIYFYLEQELIPDTKWRAKILPLQLTDGVQGEFWDFYENGDEVVYAVGIIIQKLFVNCENAFVQQICDQMVCDPQERISLSSVKNILMGFDILSNVEKIIYERDELPTFLQKAIKINQNFKNEKQIEWKYGFYYDSAFQQQYSVKINSNEDVTKQLTKRFKEQQFAIIDNKLILSTNNLHEIFENENVINIWIPLQITLTDYLQRIPASQKYVCAQKILNILCQQVFDQYYSHDIDISIESTIIAVLENGEIQPFFVNNQNTQLHKTEQTQFYIMASQLLTNIYPYYNEQIIQPPFFIPSEDKQVLIALLNGETLQRELFSTKQNNFSSPKYTVVSIVDQVRKILIAHPELTELVNYFAHGNTYWQHCNQIIQFEGQLCTDIKPEVQNILNVLKEHQLKVNNVCCSDFIEVQNTILLNNLQKLELVEDE
ncbi:Rab-like_protein [Hexamita inflata]|uniref:Rab-like protein n=1 Tax=Hexamita inflata TaxID=28002 RepID=A0AA86UVY5_9EUKA|nr:Rab-like protein [Hexamita inflata]